MRVTIASGKGGTGKTTVATGLAYIACKSGLKTAYLDCDVEEPNGSIFLKPTITSKRTVGIPVPVVDETKCSHCGKCGKVCRYSAIVCIKETVVVNPGMCHGCGGCTLVCPEKAITETDFPIGVVERGYSDSLDVVQGTLTVGRAMSPPLIRAVKRELLSAELTIIDSPPGTSCPVVQTVRETDYVVLVTEPTPFGLNDLKLAVDMVRAIGIPMGVVINRSTIGASDVRDYCRKSDIDILAELPDDRRVAEAYSCGNMPVEILPEYRGKIKQLLDMVFSKIKSN
jgi:MinD superfamily P-loop ATPase